MQEEKDYIKKEVERVVNFIRKLITKVTKSNSLKEFKVLSKEFNTHFDYDFNELIHLNNTLFKEKTTSYNSKVVSYLFNLLYHLAKKEETNIQKLYVEKALILHEIIDEKEQTFSLERLQQKQELLQL